MGQEWTTSIGEAATREELAAKYGGSKNSGGIVPSRTSANVFIFSDPPEGRKWGYTHDGPSEDGSAYFYTGQGTQGDQLLRTGNKSVANHVADGRSLRLFVASGLVPGTGTKIQTYVGEFRLDPTNPFEQIPALDASGRTRVVFVFRLLPVGGARIALPRSHKVAGSDPADDPQARLVAREIDSTLFFETSGSPASTATRGESQLVAAYEAWRGRADEPFERWAIRVPGERFPLLTDIYDPAITTLFEAKATAGRDSVRQAMGQLLDYTRHIPVPGLFASLLLPAKPTVDLQDLIRRSGFGLVYREGEAFQESHEHLEHQGDLANEDA